MYPLVVIVAITPLVAVLAALWFLQRPLQGLTGLQAEMRAMRERLGTLEQAQGTAQTNVLVATSALQTELSQARAELTQLRTQGRMRADLEAQVADSVRRLETIIAGTQAKGAAGENILESVFARLPPEWQMRDFRIGNRVVEFGLRLPNNRVLPIDSKWPATDLIERFASCDDPAEQMRLKGQIESVVLSKAREVKKYLDPSLTVNFGVAAVPDAVYDLCTAVQTDCFLENVVLVAYSMFIPYLLLVFQTVLATAHDIDIERLDTYLRSAEESVRAVQGEVEGRYARAMVMLSNSRDEMRTHLSRVSSSLAAAHMGERERPPSPVPTLTEGS